VGGEYRDKEAPLAPLYMNMAGGDAISRQASPMNPQRGRPEKPRRHARGSAVPLSRVERLITDFVLRCYSRFSLIGDATDRDLMADNFCWCGAPEVAHALECEKDLEPIPTFPLCDSIRPRCRVKTTMQAVPELACQLLKRSYVVQE
jgi:hypothetical protein